MTKRYRVKVKDSMTKTTDYLESGGYRDRFHYPDMTNNGEVFDVVPWEYQDNKIADGWYVGEYPNDWVWHESWLDFIEVK